MLGKLLGYQHRWARLLKQRMSITVILFRLRKTNFRFRLQQTNGSLPFLFSICSKQTEGCHFLLVPVSGKWNNIYIIEDIYTYAYIYCRFKWKMEAQAFFLNWFTICSSCKQKFVV
jgi:hypothetical protein